VENYIKIIIVLGLSYCLVHWAVTNPASAESMVNKVGSALTSGADFVSENLFDDETDNKKQGE
jgi:hypothetical protein